MNPDVNRVPNTTRSSLPFSGRGWLVPGDHGEDNTESNDAQRSGVGRSSGQGNMRTATPVELRFAYEQTTGLRF